MLAADVTEVCGDDPSALCEWLAPRIGSDLLAAFIVWVIDRPLRLILIVVVGWFVARLLRRWVRRVGERAARRSERDLLQAQRDRAPGTALTPVNGRSHQRANTLTSVGVSFATAAVWTVVVLLVLGEVGISLAPLLAGAGVVGVILAFGAQSVVADFLAGTFMLLEDQFGVGDVIDVGEVSGTVEKVSLRVTTLRDVHGTVWHVPNSEIHRVANKSQLWSRAVLDIDVAYDTDLRQAQGIMQRVADELWQDETFDVADIIDPPEVWGVERLGTDGVTLRLVVKTDPAEQWVVARELRLRIKEAFDEAGVEMPFPQRTLWIRHADGDAPDERPDVGLAPVRKPPVNDEMMENP
ncbi:MAG: mechanosensitive ion channel family protein [Acidimicrobiales bacterium]